MQFIYHDPRSIHRQRWQEYWPTTLLALIATGQMLLTFAIIGFETWSMILNIKYSFFFIGYNAAFFFTITWISSFTVVCCNRGSQGCATHALVENLLSLIASIVLIVFDAQFLRDPSTCYWPGDICTNSYWDITWSAWWNSYDLDIQNAKLTAIKVQLACTAVMLALCVLFVILYIYTSVKVKARLATVNPQNTFELRPQQPFAPPPPIPILSEAPPPAWPPSSTF